METENEIEQAPAWFGAAAQGIAFFPLLMSVYLIVYSAWWPFAWGWLGTAAFAVTALYAAVFIIRGVQQIRHAAAFVSEPTVEDARISRSMGILNGVTHPLWMTGAIVLLIFGQGRWVLPLMVFVIGAHFIPIAAILRRKIDYLLGPVAMVFAVAAAHLALDPTVSWLLVFAVAGIGGALTTGAYAAYMARAYRRLCDEAATMAAPLSGITPPLAAIRRTHD